MFRKIHAKHMAQTMEIDKEEINKTLEDKSNCKKSESETVNSVRDNVINFLKNTPVSELQFAAKAIVFDSLLNPKKAIEILLHYKIRAAPVVNGDEFIGVLDLRDTVKYALENYKSKETIRDGRLTHDIIKELTLSELCKHRKFRYVRDSDSLLLVAKLFAVGEHVVGVCDINHQSKKKQLIGIITQGYFFRQIVKKWKFKGNCSLQKIFELKYISHPVKAINKSIKASRAFKTMVDNDLSGLAVCDNNGVLIHNTSAADIKLWLLSSSMLDDSIEQFLISVRNLSVIERYPVSTCHLTDSFTKAIRMLQATRYHRLWIVNQYRQPIGVLALTDIFQFICKFKE